MRGPSGALSKFAEEAEHRFLTLIAARQRVVLPKLTVRVRLPVIHSNHESSSPTEVSVTPLTSTIVTVRSPRRPNSGGGVAVEALQSC